MIIITPPPRRVRSEFYFLSAFIKGLGLYIIRDFVGQERLSSKPNRSFPMSAIAARSSFINPQQFKDRIPYQTPIIAINLPRRRCTSNDKRPLQLNDGAIEGPRPLRVAYQVFSFSLFRKTKFCPLLSIIFFHFLSRILIMLCQRSLPDDDSVNMEVDFLISGLEDDPLLADVVTKKRKYFSSLLAERIVDVAKPKLGLNPTKEEPLLADLVSESKLRNKLKQEYKDAIMRYYMAQKIDCETSVEHFQKKLYTTVLKLSIIHGQQPSPVVSKWLNKIRKEQYKDDFGRSG
ncbi:uncharacterized protein LOC142531765 isoform X1 [Primulina tabacum]|uniref:uncharacterized protein LOC142531765 isoform X1 n=1 Tax=Primulina tabacum TaxID=48773 RepID=UPI003F5930C2